MGKPTPGPLERAQAALAALLTSREVARRWFEAFVVALGSRAVVDSASAGGDAVVHRRAQGATEVLPLAAAHWQRISAQVGPSGAWAEREGLDILDARQKLNFVYGADGRRVEMLREERFPGRLGELAAVLARASDPLAASVAFVAGLDDGRHGPGRMHYPVPVPGGVRTAWSMGLGGCRRALFDGRVDAAARFVVADGIDGHAVGWGATREEAQQRLAAELSRALPEQRYVELRANDDYDDEGNLIARGSDAEFFETLGLPAPGTAAEPLPQGPPTFQAGELPPPEFEAQELPPPEDPGRAIVNLGTFVLRGPRSDAPPLPRRPDCVPYVIVPLEPSPSLPPSAGRWVRLLGERGTTGHAVRLGDRDAFVLVGADVLGMVDLRTLRPVLERADEVDREERAVLPPYPFERYLRFRMRHYRWLPEGAHGPAGLEASDGGGGNRFDAACLDGEALQGRVLRWWRVPRGAD